MQKITNRTPSGIQDSSRLPIDCRHALRTGDRRACRASLELCGLAGLQLDPQEVSYFLSREKIVPSAGAKSRLAPWADRIFAAMARNAGTVTDFFNIPTNRVVELGTSVEIQSCLGPLFAAEQRIDPVIGDK